MTLDEQIALGETDIKEGEQRDCDVTAARAILASLKELAAIKSAGKPVEPPYIHWLRTLRGASVEGGVAYIDALSRYADAQADLANRNQEDAERYRWQLENSAKAFHYFKNYGFSDAYSAAIDAAIDKEKSCK